MGEPAPEMTAVRVGGAVDAAAASRGSGGGEESDLVVHLNWSVVGLNLATAAVVREEGGDAEILN